MRNLLYAATAIAGFALAAPASATLISTASSTGGALTAGCNVNDGGTGGITASCSGGGFTNVSILASGPPQLVPPDLSATTLTVAAGPLGVTTTLTVTINSSGWTFAGGPVEALFTVNNLIGAGIGPFVLSASEPSATLTHTFNGAGNATDGPTVLGAFNSDAATFVLTFNPSATAQSIDATIEIQGTAPEPASLTLMGVGLLGLGMVAMRKRRCVMKRLLSTTAIVVGACYFGALMPADAASAGTLLDSWSIGATSNVTGSLPNLSIAANQSTSNDGTISPRPDPYTEAMTLGQNQSIWAFVANPTGSGINKADIRIDFTISDGGTGTKSFSVWMDYFANFATDIDSMSWSASANPTPGYTTSGTFSASETLSDGEVVTVTVPYETDWNMAQAFQFDVTALPTAAVPEPMSIAVLAFGLLGTVAAARRQTRSR